MNNFIKLGLVILITIIVSTAIGGNPSSGRAGGCLWVGQHDNGDPVAGSRTPKGQT